jgi:translocation and assembly module TamB
VRLDLTIRATNRIFVRGDGLFAELGGKLTISGTAADPDPEGGFTLIRGDFSLAGRNLQFTQGTVGFNGGGFIPTLDLEATAVNSTVTSTLIVGGTAAAPTITLTSTPPLPSDEILANLLFGTGTQSLTPFQAASLAAALAQLSGVGGGANPLDSVRSALGLDELSLGGSGNGPPSIQAGRYVAPGIYVGAQQATNGQGTQATVEINLYKGLKLNTATGTSASGGAGASSSVGLTYQFNY